MTLMHSKAEIRTFVLGGKAVFTIENRLTRGRFTFQVKQKRNGDIHWVSLLNGPDNTSDYRFFGTIFPAYGFERHTQPPRFKHSNNGRISESAPAAKAFTWFFNRLFRDERDFPLEFEFHHAGRCGRCARQLTTPDSLRTGFGPECAQKMGF